MRLISPVIPNIIRMAIGITIKVEPMATGRVRFFSFMLSQYWIEYIAAAAIYDLSRFNTSDA